VPHFGSLYKDNISLWEENHSVVDIVDTSTGTPVPDTSQCVGFKNVQTWVPRRAKDGRRVRRFQTVPEMVQEESFSIFALGSLYSSKGRDCTISGNLGTRVFRVIWV
jgi:hypothetical protein